MQTYLNVLKGAGDIDFSIYVGIAEVSIRIVMAYALSKILSSETGIWIATPVAWIIACIYTVFRYRSGKWVCKTI
jgi:Na+-driven multidrug efflux pump